MKASDLLSTPDTNSSSTKVNLYEGLYPSTSYVDGLSTITGFIENFTMESFEEKVLPSGKKLLDISFSKTNEHGNTKSYQLAIFDFFSGAKMEQRVKINIANLINLFSTYGVPKETFNDLDIDVEGDRQGFTSLIEDIKSLVKFPLVPKENVKLKVVYNNYVPNTPLVSDVLTKDKANFKVSGNFPISETETINTGKVTFKLSGDLGYQDCIKFKKVAVVQTEDFAVPTSDTFTELANGFSVPESDMPF